VIRRLNLRRTGAAAAAVLLLAFGPLTAVAGAAAARVSFTDIESQVMCVACHEALAVAQSQEAFSERAFIRQLIAQGQTKQQILSQLVAQYGPAVLAKPPAKGFNLLIYVLPPVLLAFGIGTLVITIPRWRRRSRLAAATPLETRPPLDPEDARRLDEDLDRHLEGV
jgi:cytochrome c-type biogenesis protein CcmH